ncbi:N-acetyltransferase [Halorubrum sp. E3]|uniref:GCN5-related N-acetyltransferase n=4 Tax=Halorubrum distributum TaxID=29283 RepID=M0EC98_9EURY|nr:MULTISPECIES: GNAT family protein [Halorubrum distributum group]OYR86403.1 N-acetyltransferase [Halorubrum sp. E3]ELZ30005.1 GCN5-related N-acetyltransferase [Halorubrum terrestre JCM 10247]ELZ45436.1 GCN5-related N-acetyltransferase [Halorubrum distributum JCM 9100]ELZ56131.1 GCN5-related N-acetyltransferase [Halorubrum distributum JCM 10118]EMA57407.1 GCN5-related N-acetyltransferase [Halorubrum litoreum JCM 13561]
MFPETIETDRLRLEVGGPENVDLDECYRICSSDLGIDEVTEYVTWDPHETKKETLEFLERNRELFEADEAAGYVIRPREGEDGAGEIAGFGGFEVDWEKRTAVLGTWLRKRFWGRGYSGERAAALVAVAFDDLDLDVVAVSHHPDNEQSRRAIEKYVDRLGGRREGRLRNALVYADGSVHDEVRYTISQAEWRESTA